MKNIILSLVFLFIFTNAISQETSKEIKKSKTSTEMTSYYDNGQVKTHGYFNADNQLEGHWVMYDEDGIVLVQGEYENGMKVGTWLFWNQDSLKEVVFQANKLIQYNLWTKSDYLAQK
jgi:antitoxin component YwqK of YwqJK toxin-antitoxin module